MTTSYRPAQRIPLKGDKQIRDRGMGASRVSGSDTRIIGKKGLFSVSHHLDTPLAAQTGQLFIDDLYVFPGQGSTVFVMDVNSNVNGLADTRNNPLALVELGNQYPADQLSSRAMQPEPLPLGQRLQEHFLRQVRSLPPDAQAFALLAAADPAGDRGLLWRAAAQAGIDPDMGSVATARAGVLEFPSATRPPYSRSAPPWPRCSPTTSIPRWAFAGSHSVPKPPAACGMTRPPSSFPAAG
jgi:hypothetical protein